MSGVALLDKAGWAPLGSGEDETHPVLIGVIGLSMIVIVPIFWGLLRRQQGLPMFGSPTVARSRATKASPPSSRTERPERTRLALGGAPAPPDSPTTIRPERTP